MFDLSHHPQGNHAQRGQPPDRGRDLGNGPCDASAGPLGGRWIGIVHIGIVHAKTNELFVADGYYYNGKAHMSSERLAAILPPEVVEAPP